MAPTTKEAQRAELHKTIWRIANDLRGSVDGWDFKAYVLGMLFYRFISENLTAHINQGEHEAGDPDYGYIEESDHRASGILDGVVAEKGFFIFPSELFANVRDRASRDEKLNETLERVFRNIEGSAVGTAAEGALKGLFDDLDVNSSKLGPTVLKRNGKLVKLLNAIGDMPLGNFEDNSIDLFGDAYEYLMGMYASQAGKSGGEYYTPQEVSELLARLTVVGKTAVNKVYDPACGSGSLLLKFAKVLGPDRVRNGFYGQEINLTTYNLARINMFLHDINYEHFSIEHGDTLTDPRHWDDEPFEAIVSNPPYSTKWEGNDNPLLINDERFAPAGVLAPKSKADLAFTMHILSWLSVNGTAAIVEFPGVLYRGGAERKIRKYLIDNNYVDAVIQLPPDLFFGTTIATCIIVLKKSKPENTVLFIDASGEFSRVGNKNKLLQQNQDHVLETFTARRDVDVIEDILRIYGYNNVAFDDRVQSTLSYRTPTDRSQRLESLISEQLCGAGFHEIMNNSLTRRANYEGLTTMPADACVTLMNPLSADLNVMRQTLLFGGLQTIAHNINHKQRNLRFFEFGNCYMRRATEPSAEADAPLKGFEEEHRLGLWLSGTRTENSWLHADEQTSVYELKAYVENILRRLGVDEKKTVRRTFTNEIYSSGMTIETAAGRTLATFGIVDRRIARQADIDTEVSFAELSWTALMKETRQATTVFREIPKFPEVRRDLALLVDTAVTFAEIEQTAAETDRKLLRRVVLFDVYEGKNLPAGKKSYAVSFYLQDAERTLTDRRIDDLMAKLRRNLESKLGAQLR